MFVCHKRFFSFHLLLMVCSPGLQNVALQDEQISVDCILPGHLCSTPTTFYHGHAREPFPPKLSMPEHIIFIHPCLCLPTLKFKPQPDTLCALGSLPSANFALFQCELLISRLDLCAYKIQKPLIMMVDSGHDSNGRPLVFVGEQNGFSLKNVGLGQIKSMA